MYRLFSYSGADLAGLRKFFDLLGNAVEFYYPRSDTIVVVLARSPWLVVFCCKAVQAGNPVHRLLYNGYVVAFKMGGRP